MQDMSRLSGIWRMSLSIAALVSLASVAIAADAGAAEYTVHVVHPGITDHMIVSDWPLPDLQRRSEGLGLWRVALDGTMTWAH